uniref:Uncharacterized protein n=1 Tax=Anguilla anguilla TaxID=7936 RepID=A0A0E9W7R9_ANGAN
MGGNCHYSAVSFRSMAGPDGRLTECLVLDFISAIESSTCSDANC